MHGSTLRMLGSASELDAARVHASASVAEHGISHLIPNFMARFAVELTWLQGLARMSRASAAVLAARIVVSSAYPGGGHGPSASPPFAALLNDRPDPTALNATMAGLLGPDAARPLGDHDLTTLVRLWPLVLQADTLLTSGGDDRLALDPHTGLNRYGCAPRPRELVVSFASCTASSISAAAFAAVEQARRTLIEAALALGPERAIAAASDAIAAAILDFFQVSDLAEAVLTASGTDAALVVTGLLAAEQPLVQMTSVLVSPAETGSGVPHAVQGCHFSDRAASGCRVTKGEPVDGFGPQPNLVTIPLRDPAGQPLCPATIAQACEAAITAALPRGRVVLHAIDGSKTGLTAPDRATLLRLAERHGQALDIVIDACQARIEPALVRWYLQHGFPVLVTGSKFFGAPGFCGAVLFPRARLARIATRASLPTGLGSYARLDGGLGSRRCPGLLLRWTAALHAMARFGRLSDHEISRRLDRLGSCVRETLLRDPQVCLMAAPRPAGLGWSDSPSVFTFALHGDDGLLPFVRLRPFYLALQDDIAGTAEGQLDPEAAATSYQVGQPVHLGGPHLGGLRIAISAEQIVDDALDAAAFAGLLGKLQMLLTADRHAANRNASISPGKSATRQNGRAA